MGSGSIRSCADWIATTGLSDILRRHLWIVPTSQSVHIICISFVFASALIISLRLLGLVRSEQPLIQQLSRLTRLMYLAVTVLLFTGIVQIIAEPVRQFVAPAFWLKMFLILFGLAMTHFLTSSVRRNAQRWVGVESRPASSRIYALIYLATWSAIIVCGRFIGYTWMKYA